MTGIKKIKRVSYYSLVILINIFLLYSIIESSSEFLSMSRNFKLTRIMERAKFLMTSDLDGDRKEEVICTFMSEPSDFPYRHTLKCFSPFEPRGDCKVGFFYEILISLGEILAQSQDVDQDANVDLPIASLSEQETVLKLYNINGYISKTLILPPFSIPAKADTILQQIEFEDINGNGIKEMILCILTPWNKTPRGVIAYDIRSRQRLWEFYCGCSPLIMKTVDLNKDGKTEIILSGWGSHNNVSMNGTDDDHSYIIVLDHEGNEIWKESLGGYYTKIFFDIADIDQDGEIEIIAVKSCHREPWPEPGEIRIIDAMTGEKEKYLYQDNISYLDVVLMDSDEDKFSKIVVGDSKGKVSIFDKDLNKLREVNLEPPIEIFSVGKLGLNSTENNIFVRSGPTDFYILNQNLRKIFKYSFKDFRRDEIIQFSLVANKDEIAAILNADNMYLLKKGKLTLLSLINSFLKSGLAFYLILFIFINCLVLYVERKKKIVPTAPLEMKEDWPKFAQEIAHQMKTPLFTIQLEAERMNEAIKKEKHQPLTQTLKTIPASILDDVDRLKQMNKTLMKIIEIRPPELKEVELNLLIQNIVKRYAQLLKGKIKFEFDLDKESTFILLDEKQTGEAFSNIIENSIDALPDKGKIVITTVVVYSLITKSKKEIELSIEDSGKGIAEDKIEEIFKPYYSTKKEGMGIGLTLAKRIIEAHGGRIEVQSKEGVGTRFAVYFPLKKVD